MKNTVASLLQDDHESLDVLLTELDAALKENSERSIELLDLFWARLAVHIRAENLHLFPAIANAEGSLPAAHQAHDMLLRLRSDHDFFMKELGEMMKTARLIRGDEVKRRKEAEKFRLRLSVIRKRLESHNRLEEEHVYTWPSLLFDEKTIEALRKGVRHELENLPPRFAKSKAIH